MGTTVTPRVRRPAVSGYYYPEEPQVLRQVLDRLVPVVAEKLTAYAAIVPHGSLRHSGGVAGAVFGRIRIPRRCVIVGPSHTGTAMRWSLFARGSFRTPLGLVNVDEPLCDTLLESCPFLEADAWGQRGEHAVEVILPFLQYARPEGCVVTPIVTSSARLDELSDCAQALERAVRTLGEPVLLIASSDLSHYEPEAVGAEQDRQLLEAILNLDATGLCRLADAGVTTMCGVGAVASVLMAAVRLGATRAELLGYGTSVAAGRDPNSVVGYGGVIVR